MAATTEDRNTLSKQGELYSFPLAADAVIPLGTFVGADANGYADAATTLSTAILGISTERKDNTGGANGDLAIETREGRFYVANSGTAAVTQADVGKEAVVEDNQTVAAPGEAGPVAGVIEAVDAGGVWIDTRRRTPTAAA